MSGHTPSGWLLSSSTIVCTDKAQIIARCDPTGIASLDLPPEQVLANARLIAAAPELLKALREVIETAKAAIRLGDWKVDGSCDPDLAFARAEAAIAKATGEPA